MQVSLQPGKYVVAVSGGVDSVVLLDILHKQPGIELVVAHFDHGIRPDSWADRQHVQNLAAEQGLNFKYHEGRLGPRASEAKARQARYRFLRDIQAKTGARAIITAHHQDDLLETALLNIMRGTGRRGLSSLQSSTDLIRPLLSFTKADLITYAQTQGLHWREDSTNQDLNYRRNHIRHRILPKFGSSQRQELVRTLAEAQRLSSEIDYHLQELLKTHTANGRVDRQWFIGLPHNVSRELLASWLRQHHLIYDRKSLERLVTAAKTARSGRRFAVNQGYHLVVLGDSLALAGPDR